MKLHAIIWITVLVIFGWNVAVAETVQQQVLAVASSADENGVVTGKDGWLFLQEELEHLGSAGFFGEKVKKSSKAAKPELADPLPAIVDFNSQLKERGIDLIFVPVPPKALIYSNNLPGNFTKENRVELNTSYNELYEKLSQQGVQVLDLIPIFQSISEQDLLYCKTDTHFSGTGLAVVADEVSKLIKKSDWYADVPKNQYTNETRMVEISGDLATMQQSSLLESLPLQFVSNSKTGKSVEPDTDSSVLLLGDSHTLVFSVGGDLHSKGAGLFDHLSADLGFPVDLIGVRGSGATPSRIKIYQRSRKNNLFLGQKKVIVWCLSSRELTGSGGWQKIPVEKKE